MAVKSISVALYTVSILKKRKKGEESIKYSEKLPDGKLFSDFLDDFIVKHTQKNPHDAGNQHFLRMSESKTISKTPLVIDGRVDSGDSGYATSLHNIKSHSEHKRSKDDAELLPYYFCLAQTKDPKLFVLCTQRFGNTGIKTVLVKLLKDEFGKRYKDLKLEICDFLPDFYQKAFLEANQVKKFEYTYLSPIEDIADKVLLDGERDHLKGKVKIKISIQPQRGTVMRLAGETADGIKNRLSNIKGRKINLDDSQRLNTSVTFVNKNGKSRTFDIRSEENILPYIDVTNKIKIDNEGHPELHSIREIVHGILTDSGLI